MSDLRVYYGEFLRQHYAMEMSGNFCSHACAYCYANLNKPDREADPTSTLLLLKNAHERADRNLAARLIVEKYPVMMSNHVDPFSNSNWRIYKAYIDLLRAMNVPIGFQTRGAGKQSGGKDLLNDVITDGTKRAFFVSLTSDNPALLKSLETGAPSYKERLDLIATLKAHGHPVIAAFAPFIPHWWNDVRKSLDELKAMKVDAVFITLLHLSVNQIANMTPKAHAHFAPHFDKAKKNETRKDEEVAYVDSIRQYAKDIGLRVGANSQQVYDNIWTVFYPYYPKRFPTMLDFADYCAETKKDGDLVTWQDFKGFFLPRLPKLEKDTYQLDSYIGAASRHIFASLKIPTKMTYKQLLQIAWTETRVNLNPTNNPPFTYAIEDSMFITDANGLPVYRYSPSSFYLAREVRNNLFTNSNESED